MLRLKYTVFVSYSEDAAEFARALAARLDSVGYAAILDKRDLTPGSAFDTQLESHVKSSSLFLFVISTRSVLPHAYAISELAWAAGSRRRILGVHAPGHSEVTPPPEVAARTLSRRGGDQIANTVSDVREILGRPFTRVAQIAIATLGVFAVFALLLDWRAVPKHTAAETSVAVQAAPAAVVPSIPDLLITTLSGPNAPRPLEGYQVLKTRANSDGNGPVVYPRGAHITLNLAHDHKGDASITVSGIELVVSRFVPGPQPQYVYKADGDRIIGAGPITPLIYKVILMRTGPGRATRIPARGRGERVSATNANFFSGDDQYVKLSIGDDSQPLNVDVTATDPGLYEIAFRFSYSVLDQSKLKLSEPPIAIYYDGR